MDIYVFPMIMVLIGIFLAIISFILDITRISKRFSNTLGSIAFYVLILSFLSYFITQIIKLSEHNKEFKKNSDICASAGYSKISNLKEYEDVWVCVDGDKIINIKGLTF